MLLTDEQLEKFRQIYQRNTGYEISRAEAYEKAVKLIRLIEIIVRPEKN